MGEVYLAEDIRLDRRVALKILPADLAQDPDRMRRFKQEAKATSVLNHPNIITLHEIGKTGGTHFIVTEFIEGETLRKFINHNSFSLSEILEVAIQVASALQAAHSVDIVHRDIKPENIMIRPDGFVKVLDFGIAKLTERFYAETAATLQSQTALGTIIGTVAYMSPEQAQGKKVDDRSDIFSFGIVLYEMLTGKQPFVGESGIDIIVKILHEVPAQLNKLAPKIPSQLERIINKTLEKDPEQRYQTVKDLLADLRTLQKRLEFEAELKQSSQSNRNTEEQTQILQTETLKETVCDIIPNNLSGNFSPVVGREKEILAIKSLLIQKEVHLLTITGVGGAGKTTLAKAVARELLNEFVDGVFLVELGTITNPKLVIPTVAQSLGLKEAGGKPILEILKDFLRDKRMLLVIDNFEQVSNAAPQIAELLSITNTLKILITSRTLLRLSFEREFIVPPLSVPENVSQTSLEELSNYEAVKLFIQRAQNARPSFSLTEENAHIVGEICSRLDGLPLAIELAAARVKILSSQVILTKLENSLKLLTGGAKDLPARQQTMRGTIEWSYELLTDDEKKLFRRLAVFAGGFTFEAAEKVCADNGLDETSLELLDIVTSLVDKSLITGKEQSGGETRFRMLEIVREYAFESLVASGESDAMCRSHTKYFLALGEEAEPHFQGADSVKWLNLLEAEHDNLRAALVSSLEHEPKVAACLGAAINRFWTLRCHLMEGSGWLKKILKNSTDLPVSVRFKLLNGLGIMMRQRGHLAEAKKAYEESLKNAKAVTDLRQIALSNRGLGLIAYHQNDLTKALKYYQEGLAISRELNDKSGIANSLNFIGELARAEGEFASARPLLEEALTICRELGNKESVSGNLINLGFIAYAESDHETAHLHFTEALAKARGLGNKKNISYSLDGFAALATKEGELEKSAQLAGAAEHLRELVGLEIEPNERHCRDAYLKELKNKMNKADFIKFYGQGRQLRLEEAFALASEQK